LYTYDKNNRVSIVRDWNSSSTTYSYDADGRLASVSYSNGLSSQYAYDAVGQNTQITHRGPGGVLYSEATTWSANGNPTSSDISGLTSQGLPSANAAYSYNDADQLANTTYGTPLSDKNGNITTQPEFGGATNFTYDLNNRATAITGPSINASMKYLGDGRLAEIDIPSAKRFLIDPTASGNRILAELDASAGMQTGYVYDPMGMLSQVTASQSYAHLHNLQGSTVVLVDAMGTLRNSYHYDPFGEQQPSSTEQVPNIFSFLGSYSVPSTGKYSVTGFRVYDSHLGRFTGQDPLALGAPGRSPFLYSNQSPLRFVDPSGLFSWTNPLSFLDPAVNAITNGLNNAADNPVVIDTIKGIPKAAVTVGSCAVQLEQACDVISKSGFTPLEVAAIRAEGAILAAYYGGPAASDVLTGVGFMSKGSKLAVEIVPKMLNGTLTVPEALQVLKETGLDLLALGLDGLLDKLSISAGPNQIKLDSFGLSDISTAALDQSFLTRVSGPSPSSSKGGGTK